MSDAKQESITKVYKILLATVGFDPVLPAYYADAHRRAFDCAMKPI